MARACTASKNIVKVNQSHYHAIPSSGLNAPAAVTSSQPIRLRERLPAAWMLALVTSALLLLAGQGSPLDTGTDRAARITAAGDCAASIAPTSQGHPLPVTTPIPALHQGYASILGSSCDGDDGASDRGPSSPAAGWSPHRTVALPESSRSAVRWRHRGRGPPLRARRPPPPGRASARPAHSLSIPAAPGGIRSCCCSSQLPENE